MMVTLHSLNTIGLVDWLALGLVVFLVLRGLVMGCSGQLGRLLGLIVTVACALYGFAPLSHYMGTTLAGRSYAYASEVLTIAVMAGFCVLVWSLSTKLTARFISLAIPQPLDALLGTLLGFAKAAALLAILCMFSMMMPRKNDKAQSEPKSITVRTLLPIIQRLGFPP